MKSKNDNIVSLETRVALLEQGKVNTDMLIYDLRHAMNRMETKIDSLFLHVDTKIDALRSHGWTQFIIACSITFSGFTILGGMIAHVAHWF
jgi:hypothetical protein